MELGVKIDSSNLPAGMAGLFIILLMSTLVGVAIGTFVIMIGQAMAATVMTGGLAAIFLMPVAFATMGTVAANTFILGAIAVPTGATLAALLKMHWAKQNFIASFGLQPVSGDHPVAREVERCARAAGLEAVPTATVMENVSNAFAIGTEPAHSCVAIGLPLMEGLSDEEVAAIIGHEIGHIAFRDSKRKYFAMAYQEFLVRFLVFRGLQRVVQWMFTTIAELAILSLSRRREYWADAMGAALTSKEAMIGALAKVEGIPVPAGASRQELRFSELMFFPALGRIWSTHPTAEERIRALQDETYIAQIPFMREPPAPVEALDSGLAAGI